jgi:uncharacterized protein (DUF1800 family)
LRPLLGALERLDQPLYGYQPPTGYPDVAEAWAGSSALLQRAELSQHIGRAGLRHGVLRDFRGEQPAEFVLGRLLPVIDTERVGSIIEDETAGSEPAESLAKAVALTLASPEFQRK